MIADKLYESERFHFQKSECLSIQLQGFRLKGGFLSHEWYDTRLWTMISGQLYEGVKIHFL